MLKVVFRFVCGSGSGMKHKGGSDHVVGAGKVVVVAVKASKEISKAALVWALTHVVQPGDCIKLLVVIPSQTSSNPPPLSFY